MKKSYDVSVAYRTAEKAVKQFDPGDQVDIEALMKAAYVHGYAQALMDLKLGIKEIRPR